MKQITVIGSDDPIPRKTQRLAEEVGRAVAKSGAILITGGKGGVMEAACKGAKEEGGTTVGILPSHMRSANSYVDIFIVTGMGNARNVINVLSADAVIAIQGGAGTLSEIAHGLKAGKKVIAIRPSGGVAGMVSKWVINEKKVISVDSVEEAVKLAVEEN
ncbi:TIGR00725 family protein [[Eubacterium] cellulosolvens]